MRDGFQVSSFVFTIFTVGEPPEVLTVTNVGQGAEGLRVVRLNDQNQVIGLSDELDPEDRAEIIRWLQAPAWDDLDRWPTPQPYTFKEQVIFRSVYGKTRLADSNDFENWTDLPMKVATRVYHDMVGEQSYDVLYPREEGNPFEFLNLFRPRFIQRMRNQGMLAFQYVRRADGKPIEVGQAYNLNQMVVLQPRTFRANKVLRDRGIKIVYAGAAELRPVSEEVMEQRYLRWKAARERLFDQDLAISDYNVVVIRARARAQAQADIINNLNQILALNATRREIAQRLFQVVDAMAQESETKKYLPQQALAELNNIQRWFQGF
jgi:hypothetical protein